MCLTPRAERTVFAVAVRTDWATPGGGSYVEVSQRTQVRTSPAKPWQDPPVDSYDDLVARERRAGRLKSSIEAELNRRAS